MADRYSDFAEDFIATALEYVSRHSGQSVDVLVDNSAITEEELAKLAHIYEKMRRDEALDHFVRQSYLDLLARSDEKSKEISQAESTLFEALYGLASRRVGPFYSILLRDPPWQESYSNADWSTLPSRLNYLIKPAAKYGLRISQLTKGNVKDSLKPDELEELEKLADHIRVNEDYPLIDQWLARPCSVTEGELLSALSLMQGLLMVIDESGLRFT